MAAMTIKPVLVATVLIAAIILAPTKKHLLLFSTPLFVIGFQLCTDVAKRQKFYPYLLSDLNPLRNKWLSFLAVYVMWQSTSYSWS